MQSSDRPRFALRLGQGFRALRVRNYRYYWLGQLVSLTGTWMQTTAQSWLVVHDLTHTPQESATALGIVTTLQFLPITLLSLFGGVIADKLPKRRLLIGTQIIALLVAATFGGLVAAHRIQLWHVYVLACLSGLVNAFDNPARQSFAVELVERADLANAVALNSMLFNAARIIGPAIGGYMITLFGTAPALLFNAASFLAGIAALALMNPAEMFPARPVERGHILGQLRAGLSYAWRTPLVLVIMLVMAAVGTFGYNFSVSMPLIAEAILHTDAAGFGNLLALLGVGSLAAAVVSSYLPSPSVRRLLIAATCFSVVLLAVSQLRQFALTGGLLVLLGFCGITFATACNTLLQLNVRDDMRGRVMGIYMLLFAGSTPLGAVLITSLSVQIGVAMTLALCAVLCLLGVGGAWIYEERHLAEVQVAPEAPRAAR